MIITLDNYEDCVADSDQTAIEATLNILEDLNKKLRNDKKLSIFLQDWHDEYSCERVDPCPDYYGTYRLMYSQDSVLTWYMDADELLDTVYILFEFTELL